MLTSYLSDKFLLGLTIGYVTDITEDASTLTKTAHVTPVVDFEHLRNVLVITQLKADLVEDEGLSSTSESDSQTSDTTGETTRDTFGETSETDSESGSGQ